MCVVLFLGSKERYAQREKKEMKRMAIFIDFKFEDLEVMYPKIRLEEEGVEVHVVGVHPKGMKYTGTFETSSTISGQENLSKSTHSNITKT